MKKGFKSKANSKFTFYFMLRAFSLLVSFASFPVILKNIGSASFAKVSILLALYQFITILDWGLGNFIITRFTPIFQSQKLDRENEFATKFLPLLPITSLALVAILFFIDRTSLAKLAFSLENGTEYQARVYLFYIISLCNLVLVCLTKILLVINRRNLYQLTLTMNVVFPQIVLLGASFFSLSSIDMVLIYQVSTSIVYIFGLVQIFRGKERVCLFPSLFKSMGRPNSQYLLFLIRSSYRFFVLQLIGFITSQAEILLVAQYSDSQDVTEYSVLWRIIGIHIAFVTFIFGSSQAEINQILRIKSLKHLQKFFLAVYLFSATFISIIYTCLIVFRNKVFVLNLIGSSLSTELIIASLIFVIVWSINFPFSVVAVSDFPSVWYFRSAIISLPINLLFAVGILKFLNFNGGPLIANSISMIVFSITPYIFIIIKEEIKKL